MKKKVLIIVLVLLLCGGILLTLSSFSKEKKVFEEEVEVPKAELEQQRQEKIGTSVEGRDIIAYTYGTAEGADARHVTFVGGIHGGYEWNSVVLAYQFMDYLSANPTAIPANVNVTVIPNANPDGTYRVIGKEGRFSALDIPAGVDQSVGRFNANEVDLNRNFDCKWKPESTWKGKVVSAGTAAFSEPEAMAIRDFVLKYSPDAMIFWHSQSNAVYASECENGILPETRAIMNTYSVAAGYPAVDVFDAYPISGDAEGWLASIGIPAITVELSTHETIEWDKNKAGADAILDYYGKNYQL